MAAPSVLENQPPVNIVVVASPKAKPIKPVVAKGEEKDPLKDKFENLFEVLAGEYANGETLVPNEFLKLYKPTLKYLIKGCKEIAVGSAEECKLEFIPASILKKQGRQALYDHLLSRYADEQGKVCFVLPPFWDTSESLMVAILPQGFFYRIVKWERDAFLPRTPEEDSQYQCCVYKSQGCEFITGCVTRNKLPFEMVFDN